MKLIIFYIRPERLNTVKQEFCKRNIFKMSVGNALGCGQRKTKNCTNVLFKSIQVPAIGFLAGAIAGFSLICPGESNWMIGKVFGFFGFGMGNETMTLMTGAADPVKRRGDCLQRRKIHLLAGHFFFPGMFAATAATIGTVF